MRYSIGEVAQKTSIPASTLRYYDKHGLLPFVDRNQNGQRSFKDNDLNFLEVINCMKKSGLTIAQIRHFINLCMQGDMTLEQRYDFLDKEEKVLMKKIETLQAQLDFLRYKKWYFKTAVQAGTEKIHMTADGKRVQPDIKEQYQKELAKCVSLHDLLDLKKKDKEKFENKYKLALAHQK